jgi:hypothetical protein
MELARYVHSISIVSWIYPYSSFFQYLTFSLSRSLSYNSATGSMEDPTRENGKTERPMDMALRFDRTDPYDMMVNGRMTCPFEERKSRISLEKS